MMALHSSDIRQPNDVSLGPVDRKAVDKVGVKSLRFHFVLNVDQSQAGHSYRIQDGYQ